MKNFPLIQQVADIELLKQDIAKLKPHTVLTQWAETACEIDPTKCKAIHNVRAIYAEMDESHLDISRLLSFIETVLEHISDDNKRSSLIKFQALRAIKKRS